MPQPHVSPPKLFFYVQHLLGIGHQRRAAAIAAACQQLGFAVHFISGGADDPHTLRLAHGSKVDYAIKSLPALRAGDSQFSHLVTDMGTPVDEAYWQRRLTCLENHYQEIRPDLLLVEGYPFARRQFSREIDPLLQWAKEDGCPIVCSVRDILIMPEKPAKQQRTMATLEEYFRAVLVHGDARFIRLEQSYPPVATLGEKLLYSGYVDPEATHQASNSQPLAPDLLADAIVVSAGGGAVGDPLLRCALELAAQIRANPDLPAHAPFCGKPWYILYGPNSGQQGLHAHWQALGLADPQHAAPVLLEAARPDFRALLQQAHLSISQCGYNTAVDILASGTAAVFIPFAEGGESEQTQRAEWLASQGLAAMLPADQLTPDQLLAAMATACSRHQQQLGNPTNRPDLNGALHAAQLLSLIWQSARQGNHAPS